MRRSDDAVEHRALAFNPARRFKRGEKPKKSAKRHVYLTEADVCRLAEESGHHADLVLLLAFCGLRWGEAVALTVADIEFLKRRISVHRNAVQVGQKFEVGQTKGKEDRTVPVAASVLSRLAVRCEGRSPGRSAVPGAGRRVSQASELRLDGLVQSGGGACTGADDHAARFAALLREFGRQFRRECSGGVPDARPQGPERHVEDLRGSVRQ